MVNESSLAAIEKILDRFDFERVHKVMTALGWTWACTSTGIPTIDELRDQARRMLSQLANTPSLSTVQTGGFYAGRFHDPERDAELLELAFQVTDWGEHYRV